MADSRFIEQAYSRLRNALASRDDSTLPHSESLAAAIASIPQFGNVGYLAAHGPDATLDYLLTTILPALNGQALSSRYFGFVTGGTLPIAEAADNIVSALDQNVQMHLPNETASTVVEDAALKMLVSLLDLGVPEDWPGRTFTTGATASNIMGLACGREAVIAMRLQPENARNTVAEVGILAACQSAGVRQLQILTSMGHSSLTKAASVVGLGHSSIKELPVSKEEPWRLDIDAVEDELAKDGVASIIAVSAGEVNTGRFATNAVEMRKLRNLADRHKAWIHVDGAFGAFARALPKTEEFSYLHAQSAGLELADSITVDGHKMLNVPYDTGIFFCRSSSIQTQVFSNLNAAYLSSQTTQILSPLNIGIENSRRFRALPVYATLLSEGREGIVEMLSRMVRLARGIADFIKISEGYELLPSQEASLDSTHIIVLFRAKHAKLNDVLVQKINETRCMYVSGTTWNGQKAARLAVSSWRVDVMRDLAVVKDILTGLKA
ncbi:hypothetical protein GYMLUDRAFT_262271 [Collybiopsis luxurians FD-317 M1]|uniref:Tyrosine decarboxylase n=1 Tax=Collybiopsis luxurians FD-317 M1 TaxID=944289 RepID=A0A0D0CKJ0_9AGAR|nr:hypothetical protein GYMLUDRAFT_262271 [Collybiopsis luxurians FD-317 M1]